MHVLTKWTARSNHSSRVLDAYTDGFDAEYDQHVAGLWSLRHLYVAGDYQTDSLRSDDTHTDRRRCPFQYHHNDKNVNDDCNAAGHHADVDDIDS